ncbi:MAG TPA: GNAT family N-acetyltransferase [Beijerinckiaceae bacterium]|nr:GNAT family N-acetyltransferase [Beijerinckiaceae bacterium]
MTIRQATAADLPAILKLIADDPLGKTREAQADEHAAYQAAFAAIAADPNNLAVVMEEAGILVGYFQLTFIPGLSRRGAWRGQIESVRIATSCRNRGYGEAMMRWAIEECRRRGCTLVQLTTDKRRPAAHRFYERLGFIASHEGMKLDLT